jgi:hypothetical protein
MSLKAGQIFPFEELYTWLAYGNGQSPLCAPTTRWFEASSEIHCPGLHSFDPMQIPYQSDPEFNFHISFPQMESTLKQIRGSSKGGSCASRWMETSSSDTSPSR